MTDPLKFPGWPEAFTPTMPGFGTGFGAGANTAGADAAAAMQGSLTGGLDFIKTLWGNSVPGPAPGMIVPTVDVDELEKRIKDLKAVQAWLEINVNMLNATIQGLEVQRSTILALQSLSGSFNTAAGNAADLFRAATSSAPGDAGPADRGNAAAAGAQDSAAAQATAMPSGWPAALFAMPTVPSATADADWGRPTPVTRPDPFLTPDAAASKAAASTGAAVPPLPPEVSAPSRSRARKTPRAATSAGATAAAAPVAMPPDGLAAASASWLGMMQEQFNKIAVAAAAGAASPGSTAASSDAAAGRSAKGAASVKPDAAFKVRSRANPARKKSPG